MCEFNDIPRHKKKKVKKVKKSKHKHVYKDYLLFEQLKKQYYRAKACSICGKVYEIYFIETKKLENGDSVVLCQDEILEKYNFKYEYTEDNKIKLKEENAIYYTVEIDGEDKGIYLEKTKTYYNYFKYDFISRENERTKNLVISKEGVRVEIIFNERR